MADSVFAAGFRTGFGSAFFAYLLERFASFGLFSWKEISAIWGVEDELLKLYRTFVKVEDLIDHMEGNPLRFFGDGTSCNGWNIWFQNLKNLAYDADNLLDRIHLNLSKYCTEHAVNFDEGEVRAMILSSFGQLDVPSRISKMQCKFDELIKEMESLQMIGRIKFSTSGPDQFDDFYSRALYLDEKIVFGRLRDKDCIMYLLVENCEENNFVVIPIVGMGGIGKTTLARVVYNDERVCSIFEKIIWVLMSMDFDAFRIMKSIIEYATLSACNLSDLDSLQVELRNTLSGKIFLLVLDDYWTENQCDWDILCSVFRFGSKGSKIIVTTRSLKVSSIITSLEPYKLEILSEDDCWQMIKQKALPNVEAVEDFESIGMQIAQKCKGLPLVATTLGSLLRCKFTQEEWRFVLESELWDMQCYKNIFHPLMLSYLQLPPHLKKCFSYCSLFPRSYEFKVDKLVLLWLAEGFIQPVGSRRLEDLGSEYFNELYLRSLFQQYKIGSNETVYKMHAVIHDMAQVVSTNVCYHLKSTISDSYPLFGKACHLSLIHDADQTLELKAYKKNERLRTFLLMKTNSAENRGQIDPELFANCKSLRVLDLGNLGTSELPKTFKVLEHVRYLNLSGNRISRLPGVICEFMALQTLKLKNCPSLDELPDGMKKLSNLRRLELDVIGNKLLWMPPEFGRLTGLQTLSIYVIGKQKGHRIEELKNMNSLRGALCIKNIKYVLDPVGALEAKLEMKIYLDELELHWGNLFGRSTISEPSRRKQAEVFASLRPHENLGKLIIRNYSGTNCPDWLGEPWRKFTSIHLYRLEYCDSLPSLGRLPFLKHFSIAELPCLKSIGNEFYGGDGLVKFPSLESFRLSQMSTLEHWTYESNSAMPCLTFFTINDCPNLKSLPPKLRSLRGNSVIGNCGSLQLEP